MKGSMNDNLKVGFFFIAAGLIFAVETIFKVKILYKLWPIILIILGSGLINIYFLRKKRDVVFFGMAMYIIFFSLLALYCNFSSWEYAGKLWPLFISFAGLSFLSIFISKPVNKIYLFLGLVLLSISIVFFLVFSFSSQYWWTIFMFIGISILASGRSSAK